MKKTIHHCYRSIFVGALLLALALGASLSFLFFGHESVAQAQGQPTKIPDISCTPPPWAPVRTIQLVEEIPRSISADKPRGEFRKAEFILTLEGNERVCLASTLDGRGDLRVDDFLEFQVTHRDQTIGSWTHDFYDPTVKELEKIRGHPAQDVTPLFTAGSNAGYVRLLDFFPPWYSSSPVWLVIWGPRPTPTPTNTLTPTPTSTPTRTFTPTPTSTLTPTPKPTATLTPTPPVPADIRAVDVSSFVQEVKVGGPPFGEWLQSIFSSVEQERPFTITAEIVPRPSMQLLTVTAFVIDSEGAPLVEGIELTKQKKKDTFAGQIPGIAQTGTYSLTLHVEGIEPTGNKGSLNKTVSFVVGEPLLIRIIKVGGGTGLSLLISVLGVFWALRAFWWAPSPRLTGSLRILQGEKLVRSERLQRFRSSAITVGKRGSNIELSGAKTQARVRARYDPPIKRRNQVRHAHVIIEVSGASSGNGVIADTPYTFEVDKYELEYRRT